MMELLLVSSDFKDRRLLSKSSLACLLAAATALSACNASSTLGGLTPGETLTQGYVIDQAQIDQVPVGSSREQVILALGSPVDDRDVRQRGVLLHLADAAPRRRLRQSDADRPAHPRRLFRRGQPRHQHRQLRHAGRQGVRLHLAHDADRRQGQTFIGQLLAGAGGAPSQRSSRRADRRLAASRRRSSPRSARNEKDPRDRSRGSFSSCRDVCYQPCASTASSRSATMLVILIAGLTAGPAVSL